MTKKIHMERTKFQKEKTLTYLTKSRNMQEKIAKEKAKEMLKKASKTKKPNMKDRLKENRENEIEGQKSKRESFTLKEMIFDLITRP